MSNNNTKTFVVIQTNLGSCKWTTFKCDVNIQTYNVNDGSVVHRDMNLNTPLQQRYYCASIITWCS